MSHQNSCIRLMRHQLHNSLESNFVLWVHENWGVNICSRVEQRKTLLSLSQSAQIAQHFLQLLSSRTKSYQKTYIKIISLRPHKLIFQVISKYWFNIHKVCWLREWLDKQLNCTQLACQEFQSSHSWESSWPHMDCFPWWTFLTFLPWASLESLGTGH